MSDIITAWQCIGCGRIEAPQQCIGVCQDRKLEMVDARAHVAALDALRARIEAAEVVLRQIAHTTPHAGEIEATWLALQRRARKVLLPDEKADAAAVPGAATG